MESREYWSFFYVSLLSQNMDRDKCPHSHWFIITQTQKIGISQEAATGDDTYVQSHKPFTPL